MEVMAIVLVVVLALGFITRGEGQRSRAFRHGVAAFETDMQRLELKLQELREEQDRLQNSVTSLQARLQPHAVAADVEVEVKLDRQLHRTVARSETFEQHLVRRGIVSSEQLERVAAYRQGSGSELPTEELLVLFDYVPADIMRKAKADFSRQQA